MQKRDDLCFVTALVLLTLASVGEVLANGAYPDPLGGSGGSPYEDKCKPGDYLSKLLELDQRISTVIASSY